MPKIIIMEDDLELSYDLSQRLEAAGHQVTSCRTADSARDELKTHPYDLLITDIFVHRNNRSSNDGGISLIAWVRGRPETHNMPIIAVSGSTHYPGMKSILTVARRIGADAVLEKPMIFSELLSQISGLVYPRFRAPPAC